MSKWPATCTKDQWSHDSKNTCTKGQLPVHRASQKLKNRPKPLLFMCLGVRTCIKSSKNRNESIWTLIYKQVYKTIKFMKKRDVQMCWIDISTVRVRIYTWTALHLKTIQPMCKSTPELPKHWSNGHYFGPV